MDSEQQIIVTLKANGDGKLDTSIVFEPGIAGSDSDEFKVMTEDQRLLQRIAENLVSAMIEKING